MRFIIDGKITPYVRMTQRSKWTERAQAYLSSQRAIALQLKAQMNRAGCDQVPKGVPIAVGMRFTLTKRLYGCDLSNLEKALEDAANNVVWYDDRYIVRRLFGEKLLGDKNRAEMVVEVMNGQD